MTVRGVSFYGRLVDYMQKLYCYVDESGTLPDPHDKVIVLAAVGTNLPQTLIEINTQIRKEIRAHKKTEDLQEIKFYCAGDRTKRSYLEKLNRQSIDIFVLIVDKQGQAIPDTPENYAVLCYLLVEECRVFYKSTLSEIIFDKHFHRDVDQNEFDRILQNLLGNELAFSHADSIQRQELSAADMVAGSLLRKYTGKDSQFYELIREHIVVETIIHWKEAKRRFIERINKNLT